jgi:hypothetical protein
MTQLCMGGGVWREWGDGDGMGWDEVIAIDGDDDNENIHPKKTPPR